MAKKIKDYYAEVKSDEKGTFLSVPIMSKGKNHEILIDTSDYERFKRYNWSVLYRRGEAKYLKRRILKAEGKKGSLQLLHHSVLNVSNKIHLDHIDGNGFNCRSHNLRVATNSQNAQNSRKSGKHTSSQYKGVTWKKRDKKWEVRIQSQGQKLYLGICESEIVNGVDEGEKRAARKYDEQAILLFGAFANLNFPDERNIVTLKDGQYKRSYLLNEQEKRNIEAEIKDMAGWTIGEITEYLGQKKIEGLVDLCHYYGCGVEKLVDEIKQGTLSKKAAV